MMDRQLRRPARESQRIPRTPFAGARTDAAWEIRPRASDARPADAARELVGAVFTTPKELRHLAEQLFGELFVPTEVRAESPHAAVIALRTEQLGTLLVHAERARHWYPFRIARVEPARAEARTADGRARQRTPGPYRHHTRPRIDWL